MFTDSNVTKPRGQTAQSYKDPIERSDSLGNWLQMDVAFVFICLRRGHFARIEPFGL